MIGRLAMLITKSPIREQQHVYIESASADAKNRPPLQYCHYFIAKFHYSTNLVSATLH